MRYRKAVFIVAYRKEKNKILYLLLKRKLHWTGWEFPKGGVEKSENLTQAVRRELKEETCQSPVKIKKFNKKGKYKYNSKTRKERGYFGQEWRLFSAELKSKKIKIDRKEHSDYKWLSFKDAEKILKWDSQRKCLNAVNSYLSHA